MTRTVRLTLAILVLALLAGHLPGQALTKTTITGVVKNASGAPVEGAFVRVRNVEKGLTFMVVSQAQGRYTTPNLLPGKYMVEAIGGNIQQGSATGPVDAASGQQTKWDVELSVARKPISERKRLRQPDFAAVMPDGPAKQIVLTKCVACHDLEGVDTRTLRILGSRAQWQEVIDVHRWYMEDRPDHLTNEEVKLLVDYMTKNFSRESHPPRLPREPGDHTNPDRHLPAALLKGAEAKFVSVEFTLRRNADPHDISVDSQGIAWISEHSTNERGAEGVKPGAGTQSRIDPKTFAYAQMTPPPGNMPSRPSGSAVDPQGVIWHDDNGHNNRLLAYNPKTEEFKAYPMPAPPRLKDENDDGLGNGSANMNTLTFQDGFVWGSGLLSDQIYRLDPASGEVITYPFPKGTPPYGLAFDKNKMLWTSLEFADEIVKMDPATGKKTHYKVPTRHSDLRHIQTDAEGNVWASAQQSDKLIKVDGRTGHMTEYEPPTKLSGIDTVDVDRKHNVIWVGEDQGDKLARFDPRTNSFTEFPLPFAGTGVKRIAIDPANPNRVWWCSTGGTSKAGYIEVFE
jgi:streptogramin lyase